MNVRIFVEGPVDRKLLERLLDDLKPRVSFNIIETRGRDAARPLARKHLLKGHEPVVLVVDADTTDERKATLQRRDLEEYLAWGAASTPFKVSQFVPELEVVFFDVPGVLQSVAGTGPDKYAEEAGKLAPRRVLEMLTHGLDRFKLIDRLKANDVAELRKHPVIADLRTFVESSSATGHVG